MKNKILLTLTSLLLAGSLVACTVKPSKSSEESSDPESAESEPTSESEPASESEESSESSESIPEEGWTADQLALMDANLHGVYLPFPEFAIASFDYDASQETLVVLSEANDLTLEDAAAYASLFKEEDGWYGSYNDGSYYFKKEVETEEGTRFAATNFAIVDEDGYLAEEAGQFMLYAYDPYYYEWPAETVEIIVAYFGSEAEVPAFEADFYSLNTTYVIMGIFGIYCYTDDKDAEDVYADVLEEAGYTVSEERNSSGYFVAVAETLDLEIDFAYDEEYGDLDIFLYPYEDKGDVTVWPADAAAAIVEALVPGSETEIPALEGADEYDVYITADDVVNYELSYAEIDAYGEEDLLDDFAAILDDADWAEVDEYAFLSENEDIYVSLSYNSNYKCVEIVIGIYVAPVLEWPTEDAAAIVEALVPGSETIVPALEDADSYDTFHDAEYAASNGHGEIDAYGAETLLTAYLAVLEEEGWKETSDGYVSPADDILLEVDYNDYYGCVEIVIYPYTAPSLEWPSAKLAALGAEQLPEFEGENNGFLFLDDAYGTAVVVYVAEGTEEAAVAAYEETLVNNNFTLGVDGYYHSEDGTLVVSPYFATTGTFTIAFYVQAVSDEFPLDEVNEFLATYDLGFELTEGLEGEGFSYLFDIADGYHYMVITVEGNQLEAFNDVLGPIVTTAGYEIYKDEETSICYYNEDEHEVQITYNAKSDTTEIVLFE